MSRLLLGLALVLAACQTSSPSKSAAEAPDASAPVARWNGGSISRAELDAYTFPQRQQALEQLAVQRVVQQKAKAAGMSTEAFMRKAIEDKIQQPTDAEMQKLYDQRVKGQPGAPPFEQMKPQIAQFLMRQKSQDAYHAFVEKVKADAKIEILLTPARMKVAADGPSKGPASAPVTIVEFSDYQCPFCARAEDAVGRVMKDYDGKVRLVYRDFPLPAQMHPQAEKAAEASQCALDQGKYWEMHDKLFQNQQALQPDKLKGYAKDLGLDQAKFDKCLDSGEKAKVVETHREAGEAAFVNATPSFFVNGQPIAAPTYDEFKKTIDGELARK